MRKYIILWCIFQLLFFFLLNCDHATKPESNRPPQIEQISISSNEVEPGDSVGIRVIALDPDGDRLLYSYNLTGGSITDPDSSVTTWIAPQEEGQYTITVTVSDGNLSDQESVIIKVQLGNGPPVIEQISTSADTVEPGGSVELKVTASDPDGDKLQYSYNLTGGSITNPDSSTTFWIAPQEQGQYTITVTVSDGSLSDNRSVIITVIRKDTSRYGFEKNEMGWEANTDTTSQAIYSVQQTYECAFLGSGSLKMMVRLIGNHPRNYQGEADVDWRYYPPSGLKASINMLDSTITAHIKVTETDAMGPQDPTHSEKNYLQIIIKDINWNSECGDAQKINVVNEWIPISLTPSWTEPTGGSMDSGFDPTKIIMVGVKIGSVADSTYTYTGPIYLDAFDW